MGISFFHPEFFWALPVVALPILLHFLKRKPVRTLEFSTLRFFKQAAVAASNFRTLKSILQLLCRIILILCLLVIFAQPYVKSDPFSILQSNSAALYVWVDPTVSMEFQHVDGQSRIGSCRQ
ncbi:MAG: BatA domain-containing protein, partial [Chitinivibrionales bacterium]|nr:BatA domain-containing protein [Chitinivibrionales bacterium]